jgi:hypothetical protein
MGAAYVRCIQEVKFGISRKALIPMAELFRFVTGLPLLRRLGQESRRHRQDARCPIDPA